MAFKAMENNPLRVNFRGILGRSHVTVRTWCTTLQNKVLKTVNITRRVTDWYRPSHCSVLNLDVTKVSNLLVLESRNQNNPANSACGRGQELGAAVAENLLWSERE